MPPRDAWSFVPMDGTSMNDQTKQIVRRNAMRHFRRNERLARVKQHAEILAEQDQTHETEGERSEVKQEPEEFTEELFDLSCDMIRVPRQEHGVMDPFGSTVVPGKRDAWMLFSHFVNEIAPKLQPVGSTTSRNAVNKFVTQSALSDHGLLSTILFHAGVHLDAFHRRPRTALTMYYLGETMQILNERLQSKEDATSDSSIAMVGFLSSSGNITGDVAADHVHARALQTMISARGGLNNLGWRGALATLISVGDLIGSTILDCEPRLEAPDITGNKFASQLPVQFLQQPMRIPCEGLFAQEICWCMRALVSLVSLQADLFSDPELTVPLVVSLTQIVSALEHRLLRCRLPPILQSSAVAMLYEACRLAQLICISHIFRNFHAPTATLRSLSYRLGQILGSLENVSQNITEIFEKRMLAWIVSVGGIGSLEQEWYVIQLKQMMVHLQITTYEEWRALLCEFVWSPRMENGFYDSLLSLVWQSQT